MVCGHQSKLEIGRLEINEIQESLDDIIKYCVDCPEIQSLSMIDPALNNIRTAIQQKK